MPLSVVGAGFGRTGTLSLKLALERLGLGPCHHMEEVLKHPGQLRHWQDAVAGRPVDWGKALAGYRSVVDWPAAHFWRELAAAYPRAKVVLTVRPEAAWWASFSRTILPLMQSHGEIPDPHVRDVIARAAGRQPVDERTVVDIRVPVVGGEMPFVYLKYRPLGDRFRNANSRVEVAPTGRVLSLGERERIRAFCRLIGLDLGELDVLRDAADGRIYVVDVNHMPFGPPRPMRPADASRALRSYGEALLRLAERPAARPRRRRGDGLAEPRSSAVG
jgi:hypothetical protein